MKKIVLSIVLAVFTLAVNAQEFSKIDKSIMDASYYPDNAPKRAFIKDKTKQMEAEPKIRILYSRPLKNGRTIFGDVVKFNEAWRIGANESTEVLFMTDVVFGGTKVKAGRYTLIAIPTEKEWTVKLNSVNDGWGNYSHDPAFDIASITVPTLTSDKEIEALSITMYEKSKNVVHIKIGWDKTIAEIPVTLK
ncbi:DUF2911 domain-containing protein [Flavobacterium jejuense]|uniref:DUF2911 domain-containing protein n=1 Tax=Flavobacterium jejuense TaxID=1544455 RepID=A0ABX0ITW3_9FLAO|nr:DUF2911 domain-containing protein [Flavobacterium jejuense]NHN27227.1 DUF2911 domain-containing protein [Flavobacterium jejuense]